MNFEMRTTQGHRERTLSRTMIAALVGLIALGVTLMIGTGSATAAKPALFKAGAAAKTINPDSPQYVGGYGYMEGPTEEVHDDLEVRAFVVGKGKNASVFVIADLTGWFAAYRGAELEPYGIDRTREKIADKLNARGYDIDRSSVIVATTHTHSAPAVVGIWGTIDPAYLKKVSDSAVAAADQAARTAKNSEIWTAVGNIRSFVWQNGQGTNHPDGFARDNELPIMWARNPDTGATNALFANVPNHPDQYHMGDFSADWPGYARRKLDVQNGGTTVIGPGTLGSQEPPGSVKEYSEVIPQGEFVANEIQRTMARATPLTSSRITSVESPLETVADNDDLILGINLFDPPEGDCIDLASICTLPRSTEFPYMTKRDNDDPLIGTNVVSTRIGDVIYSTNPGEAFAEVNFAIRDSISGARHANTIGLAGDFLGYYYVREDYTEQQFGSSNFPKYNVGPDLPQMNADIARENATELGFETTPQTVHAPFDADVEDRPGLQWYPDRTESADPTINIYGTASRSQDKFVEAPETIEWDFDDGSTGSTDNGDRFDHTFPGPGTYEVTATVTGSNSKTRTWTETITINPPLKVKAAVKSRKANNTRLIVTTKSGSGKLVSARWICPNGKRFEGLKATCPGPKGGKAKVVAVDGAGNQAHAKVKVKAARGKLKILAAKIKPARIKRGKTATLRIKIKNVGNGAARGVTVCVKVPKRFKRDLKVKQACTKANGDKKVFYRPGKVRVGKITLRTNGPRTGAKARANISVVANARGVKKTVKKVAVRMKR